MSNKRLKRHPKKVKASKNQNKKTRIPLFGSILAIATLLGYAILIPRVTAVVSDPPDENDPFSSSITITNTGYIPLHSVTANFSVGTIKFLAPQGPLTVVGDEAKQVFSVSKWPPHDLGLDDRFTVSLNDPFIGNRRALISAQIAVIVKYEWPLVHIHAEKRFPIFAKKASNGNFYWYADTLPTNAN
jgi:hypothetical protein